MEKLKDSPFKQLKCKDINVKELGHEPGEFQIIKLPRLDQLVCFQYMYKNKPFEVRQMANGNFFEQAYFLYTLGLEN